jgi:hypothetical protein
MTVIAGQRTTGNVASEQREIDLSKPILLLEPEAAPVTVISKMIRNGGNITAAKDSTFYWDEDELETRFDAINHTEEYSTEATALVVDTPSVFYKGALVKIPRTGEIVLVTAVTEGESKLTVTRGYSGSTAAKIKDNDQLFVIGLVAEEGDTSPEARTFNPTKKTNYTQIFRKSVEATGTWLSSSNMTSPHDWSHQHKKAAIEHLKDIEHAFLFGKPATTTGTNGRPQRTTGGLLHFYTQNNSDAGGELTETEFEAWVRSIMRDGSNKKTVFVSPLVLSVINDFAVGRLQVVQADENTKYGIGITSYKSAHGELKLVKHNLLEGEVWGGMAIAVDFRDGGLKYRPLNGTGAPGGSRDTKLLTNRQENDRDGKKDEWLTEVGLQAPLAKTGGVLTGVTT